MKLWLDDKRRCPEGWVPVYTAEEAIAILDDPIIAGLDRVEGISLDHDLGDADHDPEWTGYTVLQHIERKVVWEIDYVAPALKIHTDNAGAIPKMRLAIASIDRFMRQKDGG